MKITKITAHDLSVPLKKPFITALRSVNALENVLIRIETDEGVVGYGGAASTAVITGETLPSIKGAVLGPISNGLIGKSMEDFDEIMLTLQVSMIKNTSAKAAVDMALYDIRARSLGVPMYKLLGGSKKQFETDITISLNSPEVMVADSRDAVKDGFRILKIKVGKDPVNDPLTVGMIRKAVGPDITLRVDPNQGWLPKDAVRAVRIMEDKDFNIEFVEQPVHASDIKGLRFVTERVQTPILADESVFSPEDAELIIRTRSADLINIKLMKTGGIYNALKICSLAETYRIKCMIGCMLESRLSVSAAAHLAAAKNIIQFADLDGPFLCAEDPFTGGPRFDNGDITMTNDPGLGVCPNSER